MIVEPGEYDLSPHDNYRPGLSEWDFSRLELQADHLDATRIVNRIMGAHDLDIQKVRAKLDHLTARYIDASQEKIDLRCLSIFN